MVQVVKNPSANAGDVRDSGSIPGLGGSPGGGHGNPLQYPHLESPRDRRAWWAMVHRVTKSWIGLKRISTQAHGVNHGKVAGRPMGVRLCAGAWDGAKKDCQTISFIFLLDEGKLFASKEEKTYQKKSRLKLCSFCDHILKWRDLSEPFSSRSWLNWIPTGENEFFIRTYFICLKWILLQLPPVCQQSGH